MAKSRRPDKALTELITFETKAVSRSRRALVWIAARLSLVSGTSGRYQRWDRVRAEIDARLQDRRRELNELKAQAKLVNAQPKNKYGHRDYDWDAIREKITPLIERGFSNNEIARACNKSGPWVFFVLKKLKITTNSKTRARQNIKPKSAVTNDASLRGRTVKAGKKNFVSQLV